VRVEVAEGFGVIGVLIEQVAPNGQPVTASDTAELKPFKAAMVAVEVPVPPCVSVKEFGLASMEKSGVVDALT